jgi:putative spermidine/putrescine transport system permease protein
VIAFLYLPLIIVAIYAFNTSRLQAWPPQGLTLHWFEEALQSARVIRALINTLLAATFATAVALVLGTLASIAVHRYSFFGRQTISFALVLPIALPGVVTGVALQRTFITLGVDLGLMTIVVGHATFCVVIVYNNVIARLRRLPKSPEEASADLGADMWTTFRRVTGPRLGTALMSGALLSFALSFDEIIVTLFTAGPGTQTIPMFIFASIQRPNELPVVNVVAFVLILLSVIPVWLAQRISGAETAGARL